MSSSLQRALRRLLACLALLLPATAVLGGLAATPAGADVSNPQLCFGGQCPYVSGTTLQAGQNSQWWEVRFTTPSILSADESITIDASKGAPGTDFTGAGVDVSNESVSGGSECVAYGTPSNNGQTITISYDSFCDTNPVPGFPIPAGSTVEVQLTSGTAPTAAGSGDYFQISTSADPNPVDTNTFNVTPGQATQLAFTTQPGGASAGAPFATQPAVTSEDQYGNPSASTGDISLAVTDHTGEPGASLTGCSTAATQSDGVATFSGCEIDRAGNDYTLTASEPGVSSGVSQPFSVAAGPPAQLQFVKSPDSGIAGQSLQPHPEVAVEDAEGNVVSGDTSEVSLALVGSGPAGAALDCAPVAAVSSRAHFSDCSIDTPGDGYQLQASDGSLTTATSPAFGTTGPPSRLVVTTQPKQARADVPFGQQPVVTVEDATGAVVTAATGHLDLGIASGTGTPGAQLAGCGHLTLVDGVATGHSCRISAGGHGYRLSAAYDGLTALSHQLTVDGPTGAGYWTLTATGKVDHFGDAKGYGSPTLGKGDTPVDLVTTADRRGYWTLTAQGAVSAFGDAGSFGSATLKSGWGPAVALAPTPDEQGYWVLTRDGHLSKFGDASSFGSPAPATGQGKAVDLAIGSAGLWMLTSTGHVVSLLGPAAPAVAGGRTGGKPVALVMTPDNEGYWIVSTTGAIAHAGDARPLGATGQPTTGVVGAARTPDGKGLWLLRSSGQVLRRGQAASIGRPSKGTQVSLAD